MRVEKIHVNETDSSEVLNDRKAGNYEGTDIH